MSTNTIGMKYRNIQKMIFLTKTHKERRAEMAKTWITSNHDWNKTIFSDDERLNLDCPDNWMAYVDSADKIKLQRRQ